MAVQDVPYSVSAIVRPLSLIAKYSSLEPSGDRSLRSGAILPWNYCPGVKVSVAVSQWTICTHFAGPRRKITPTGASRASITDRRQIGGVDMK